MKAFNRRSFLKTIPFLAFASAGFRFRQTTPAKATVMTVRGPIDAATMGTTLPHEHLLVDFIGAKLTSPQRWNRDEVMDKVLPFLDEAKAAGCNTLVDCTPNYLGRDVVLLKRLAENSKVNILTNTGYYGGSDNKFLPDHAFTETADTLAGRWQTEYKSGIDNTGIKPGFIKISVNDGPLSDISKKLIAAAAITHIRTGLTIASHTGPASPAFEQLEILKKAKVHSSAFIWVHAQNEKDRANYVSAARQGAWISLDGLNDNNFMEYVDHFLFMKDQGLLSKVLLSHDAGWYEPGKVGGGEFRHFTTLFKKLIPALEEKNVSDNDIRQVIQRNPSNAFSIAVRRLK